VEAGGREQRPADKRARLRDGAQPAVRAAARRPLGSSPVQEAARHPVRLVWTMNTKQGRSCADSAGADQPHVGSQAGSQPEDHQAHEAGARLQ
jgi:hypothetical protein